MRISAFDLASEDWPVDSTDEPTRNSSTSDPTRNNLLKGVRGYYTVFCFDVSFRLELYNPLYGDEVMGTTMKMYRRLQ